MRIVPINAALLATSLAACAVVEPVGRPPSAGEIARINDAVEHGRGLVVEPSVPRVEPLARCAGGSCGQRPDRAAREIARSIVSADERQITFATKRGTQLTLPLEAVGGVKVTAADRAGGAGLGVVAGLGVDLVAAGFLTLLSHANFESDPGAPPPTGCDSGCKTTLGLLALIPLVAGGIAGWSIGVPRRYTFAHAAPRRAALESSDAPAGE